MSNLIQVLNYPHHLSQFAIYDIFATVGEIINVHRWTGTNACQITFRDATTAQTALTKMNGAYCGGVHLQLALGPYMSPSAGFTARTPFGHVPVNQPTQLPTSDASIPPFQQAEIAKPFAPLDRRHSSFVSSAYTNRFPGNNVRHCNAYLLNLSLDMTNEELQKICGSYGEVKHICILATLDNAGRRRAFVDMSRPQEAAALIRGLNGKRLHGYELHCSYAFVQRSGGPIADTTSAMPNRGKYRGGGPSALHPGSHAQPFVDEGAIDFGAGALASRASSPGYSGSGLRPPSLTVAPGSYLVPSAPSGVGRVPSPLFSACSSQGSLSLCTAKSPLSSTASPTTFGNELRLGNLSPAAYIDSEDLSKLFESRGFAVVSASLETDSATGMSTGCGTVEFKSADEAEKAFSAMDGKVVDGLRLSCEHLPAKFGRVQEVRDGPAVPSSGRSISQPLPQIVL